MEPDVVEIAPPLFPSGSRTRKPRKAGIPEVIDVEQYEFSNGGIANNANLVDKKNKGKSIQDGSSYDHFADVEEVVMSTTQPSWFPSSSSSRSRRRHFNRDASASSSRPRAAVEVVSSAQATFLREFKRFDTVEDFSDHHYVSKGKASKQHSRTWVKKIQSDWKILENDLPETISVRACETRMDLMRAVIVGAEGTPYHDGLFFFDIHFTDTYPSVPPMVHYHSGGLRINPNLYNCGKVCLSLLGTWNGNARERWLPHESTMLQLLVSIQALILNQKPYFNEPAYGMTKGTPSGEAHSKVYSENVFILSLRTMVYSMRKPPKVKVSSLLNINFISPFGMFCETVDVIMNLQHFEEFVRSHYFERAHDIVKGSNAYIEGAPVGSIVKGGVQDIEESRGSGSTKFRTEVASFMKTVVEEFVKLGVKELEANCKRSRILR
ncbi:ubiquitin-conjugating enzyme E2 26 [Hirschfeldia incana]|nr:ubiquitin-conjugating enzyme E2 26 [Hirschfeldia incana]